MQIIKLGHLLLPKRKREVHLLSRSSFGLGGFTFDVPAEVLLAEDISGCSLRLGDFPFDVPVELLLIVETLETDVFEGGVQL